MTSESLPSFFLVMRIRIRPTNMSDGASMYFLTCEKTKQDIQDNQTDQAQ